MRGRLVCYVEVAVAIALLVAGGLAFGIGRAESAPLPHIREAPRFTLTTQDGEQLALDDLRGKVVAVTFVFATCTDTCPLLTAKLVGIQSRLGADFGSRVHFVSITVDPEHDTPEVLARYARAHATDPTGWAFLTGSPADIVGVAREYGVFVRRTPPGVPDHGLLTSLVDRHGILRVQYLGTRFDPDELYRDLRALVRER